MKLNLDIAVPSKQEWIDAVMADFPSFLQDHIDCERKASAMAMSFVAKYPDRKEIIPELIEIGIEELEHLISMNNQTDEQKQNELNFWNGKVNNMRRDLEYQQQFSQNMIESSEKVEREVTSLRQALDMKDKNQELL